MSEERTTEARPLAQAQSSDFDGSDSAFPKDGGIRGHDTTQPRRRGYFGRHWRGELSLPVSYWLSVFLAIIVLTPIALILTKSIGEASHPMALLGAVVITWLSSALFTIWQGVGVWRSARNHISRGASRFWARTAQAMILIGALSAVHQFFTVGVLQIVEISRMALGDDAIESFDVSLSDDGQVLKVSGGFKYGLFERAKAVVERSPGVAVVILNSTGGRLSEARKLAVLIQERGLATYTTEECLSACTVPFLAGNPRGIAEDAQIGFHEYSFPGSTQDEVGREIERDKDEMQRSGIDRAFLDRALSIKHDDMWFPTAKELVAARVITQPPGPIDLDQGVVSLEYVEKILVADPGLRALRESNRGRFDEIALKARTDLRAGISQDEVIQAARMKAEDHGTR